MSWLNDYQDAFEQAKQANLNRYNTILGGYAQREIHSFNDYRLTRQRETDINRSIFGVGQSQRDKLKTAYDQYGAKAYQSMAGRGLTNSTLLDSASRANDRERESAKMELEDKLTRERTDYAMRTSADSLAARARYTGQLKDKLDFQERRTDAYPDPRVYMAAGAMNLGNFGGGGGGWDGSGGGGFGRGPIPQTPNPFMPGYTPTPGGTAPTIPGQTDSRFRNQYNMEMGPAYAAAAAAGGSAASAIGGGMGGAFGAIGGLLGGAFGNQTGYGGGMTDSSWGPDLGGVSDYTPQVEAPLSNYDYGPSWE